MTDDSLERRVAWLEWKMVRVLWGAIGGLSMLAGIIAYRIAVDTVGEWGALSIGVVVWLIVGWYLHRTEFRGAPAHVKLMDP
jgi:hypothetical protein